MSEAASRQIVITGATRGCGRALTEYFIRLGHTVHGCGRDRSHIAALVKQFPGPHSFYAVDVADDSAVAAWSQQVLQQAGPPDLLLNNAATIAPNAVLWEMSDAEFRQTMEVNVIGVANVIRHWVPAMVERGRGLIVNFSSGWGRSVSPEVAAYCASKWAIEGLTKALAEELPQGMAAIPLNPGIIDTDLLRVAFGDGASSYPSPTRWAEKAGPFLLSLNAGHNGKSLSVPGV
ncbi:MAG: SDR family NAD(P)-dependent oxidoreductase [Planctomycetaceae bacterium]|nr:SDR family NAD(P)-dependent oxidoreductase [Planctomycetaceae bacterium]